MEGNGKSRICVCCECEIVGMKSAWNSGIWIRFVFETVRIYIVKEVRANTVSERWEIKRSVLSGTCMLLLTWNDKREVCVYAK